MGGVDEPQNTITIQENHDWYRVYGKGRNRTITGTTEMLPLRTCLPNIDRTSGYGRTRPLRGRGERNTVLYHMS